jgi:hypothetical protein
MKKRENLSDQRHKLEEVPMWLLYRLGTENDTQARKEMFQTWRLLGFASVHLETVNFLTNNEYNDCETERGQPVN